MQCKPADLTGSSLRQLLRADNGEIQPPCRAPEIQIFRVSEFQFLALPTRGAPASCNCSGLTTRVVAMG